MIRRFGWARAIVAIFWVCSLITVAVWARQPLLRAGWDVGVYKAAIVSLRAGHDPYADATAIQRVFYSRPSHPPGTILPYSYVYSPITLPMLRLIAAMPFRMSGMLYWAVYVLAVAATLCVMYWVAGQERRIFRYILPAVIFFPGMLQNESIFSGNVAYILYGCIFVAALVGWTRGKWLPFYVMAVVASCVKAPMLSVLVVPVLSARRQWMPAAISAAVGVALFVVQPRLWPSLFHNYLMAVELQFNFNHDFSSSPAGLLADALFHSVPYQVTSAVAYAVYATTITIVLLALRRKFLAGAFDIRQWAPVMLVGMILLNPRIMEYDAAAITVPMALVMWRFFARMGRTQARTIVLMAIFFAVINVSASFQWKPTECGVLLVVFSIGAWQLFAQARERMAGGAYEGQRGAVSGPAPVM